MSKTILITGTSSGFGRDTAETLHRAGHTVYASMRGAEGKNRQAAEALRKLGIKTVELDVSDDTSVEAGVKTVLAEAGNIDVLVNNAGIASAGVTEAFTTEQTKEIFDTNVIGLLRVTRAVLPSMRQQHDGLIINIGSILGRVTFPLPRHLRREQVRGRSADRQPPLRTLAARRRGRGGAAERIPDQLFPQHSDARRHRGHRVLWRGRSHPPTPWSRP
jgi:NAD(P)-dependent dehydrogenase (short-subunit alcohol dehydrogenase family)